MAVASMRQHATGENKRRLWLTPMEIATGIKEIADEWEQRLNKIPCGKTRTRDTEPSSGEMAHMGGGSLPFQNMDS